MVNLDINKNQCHSALAVVLVVLLLTSSVVQVSPIPKLSILNLSQLFLSIANTVIPNAYAYQIDAGTAHIGDGFYLPYSVHSNEPILLNTRIHSEPNCPYPNQGDFWTPYADVYIVEQKKTWWDSKGELTLDPLNLK